MKIIGEVIKFLAVNELFLCGTSESPESRKDDVFDGPFLKLFELALLKNFSET